MPEDKELMEEIALEVDEMSEEQLEAEAKKILAQQAKRAQYSKNKVLSPEAKEKQKEYRQKTYLKNKLIMAKYKELTGETE